MSRAKLAATIDAAFEARETVGPKTKGAVRKAVTDALGLLDSGKAAPGRSTSGSRKRCCCRSASTT